MRTKTFRRLMTLTGPFWRGMTLAAALGVLTIASSIGLMATSAWLISKAGLQPSIAELGVAVVAVRFFGIARAGFRYLERLVSHDTTFRLLAALRVTVYRAIEPLAPARLAAFRSGDLMGRIVADVDTLENVYLRVIAPPLVALATACLMALLFLPFSPLAALVVLAALIFTGTAQVLLNGWIGHWPGRERITARADLNAALVDTIQGLADSTVYGQAESQREALAALSRQLDDHEETFNRLDGLQTALGVLLSSLTALAVLVIAIPRVEPIYLATLTLATIAAFEAVMPLAQAAAQLGENLAAARRLFEIMDTPPALIDPAQPLPMPDGEHDRARFDLIFEDVTFRYAPDEPPVFDGLNLAVPAGRRIAIIGASGAGKSTLVNLLVRFWDPERGHIRLAGLDLRACSQADVRQRVAVMTQRTYLFNTTIRENIRIAHSSADDKTVIAAARQARIDEFIATLPDGYDTFVGENGAKLSGGERQRVALARVLLRDAPIIVLDEATANLDPVTARAIMATIRAVTQGRTLIVFTHQTGLLDGIDQIYELKDGRLHPRDDRPAAGRSAGQ